MTAENASLRPTRTAVKADIRRPTRPPSQPRRIAKPRTAQRPRKRASSPATAFSPQTVRAEVLFTSDLPTGAPADRASVETAIREAVRANGGIRGCVARLAWDYGDHPETAAPRMAWALRLAEQTKPRSAAGYEGSAR
jgi:hypothetical protein